jgi:hypothetical protein
VRHIAECCHTLNGTQGAASYLGNEAQNESSNRQFARQPTPPYSAGKQEGAHSQGIIPPHPGQVQVPEEEVLQRRAQTC